MATPIKLSNPTLAPNGAQHFYSYSMQFSPAGYIVFDAKHPNGGMKGVVLNPDLSVLTPDVLAHCGLPRPSYASGALQWSQEGEYLLFQDGWKIYQLDPPEKSAIVLRDYSPAMSGFPGGRWLSQMSIGPLDCLSFHVTGAGGLLAGILFDNGAVNPLIPPFPGHGKFDEANVTQSGMLLETCDTAPAWLWENSGLLPKKMDDNHGHPGFFEGCIIRVVNDTLPNGSVGQLGCTPPGQKWRPELAIYDDVTGKRLLKFGCDPAWIPVRNHFSRSLKPGVVFASDFVRIARYRFDFSDRANIKVAQDIITDKVGSYYGNYWANPRAASDHTGTRALYDAADAIGRVDVWLVEEPLPVPSPPPAPIPVPTPVPVPTPPRTLALPATMEITDANGVKVTATLQ